MLGLLVPVFKARPHWASRIRALHDSGHAQEFRNVRCGINGHPAEWLSGLLAGAIQVNP